MTDDFTDLLDVLIGDEVRHLADGKAKDYEEYKMRCGKIAGYRRALDEYRAHQRAIEHDDD